jgi:hypothetical protein
VISHWLFETLAAVTKRLSWAEPFDWDDEDELLVTPARSATKDFAWR